MSEKRKPHYILNDFMELFRIEKTRIITNKAYSSSVSEGYMTVQSIVEIIDRLSPKHFYKSMTSHHNHRIWQDVYKYRDGENPLYIKLQLSVDGKQAILIQMKRDEGSDG